MELKEPKIPFHNHETQSEDTHFVVRDAMYAISGLLLVLFIAFLITSACSAKAQEIGVTTSVRFNNENIHTTPQPAPIGGTYEFGDLTIIPLEQGKTLKVYRYIVEPEYGISIIRYEIDEAFWFVTNKGVIYGINDSGIGPMASTSLQALSIYLTL